MVSGISPCQTRVGSVCDGVEGRMRKRSSGAGGVSGLSREVEKDGDEDGVDPFGGFDQGRPVTVAEE